MKSLFGYANTTKAIARSGGWAIYDDKFERISSDEWGNLLLPSSHFKAEKSQLEIPSPGFALGEIFTGYAVCTAYER